jgi:hypothetical protein
MKVSANANNKLFIIYGLKKDYSNLKKIFLDNLLQKALDGFNENSMLMKIL